MKKIEEAIHIMEPEAELTDEQLRMVENDAELREACQDIMILQGMLADNKKTTRTFSLPAIKWIAAAAALFVGAFFLLWPDQRNTTASQESLPLLSSTITITTPDGQRQALSLEKDGDVADAIYTVPTAEKNASLSETFGEVPVETVTIPYGHSLQIILSDGTRVYMHPGSRLVYPDRFVGSDRKVTLSGEAYFCVAHDPERPFTVHTTQGDVRDYGTEFNVCAEGGKTEVVLVEGSVSVTPIGNKEHFLQPGQMATMDTRHPLPIVETVDTDPYTAWRDGYFYFNEQTLDDIITQLACSYNLSMECHNPDLLHLRLRYIIPRNSTAAYAVEILNRLQRGHVSLEGNRIVVK